MLPALLGLCPLHCCCIFATVILFILVFYTSCPPSTCLVRARRSARQLSRSPACAALSRDRDSRSPHSWLPAHFCMFTPATRPRAPALARDHLSCAARFPGFLTFACSYFKLPLLPAPAVVVQLQSQVLVISIHHHAPLSAVTTDCRSRLARALYVTECASACNARRSCVKHDFD